MSHSSRTVETLTTDTNAYLHRHRLIHLTTILRRHIPPLFSVLSCACGLVVALFRRQASRLGVSSLLTMTDRVAAPVHRRVFAFSLDRIPLSLRRIFSMFVTKLSKRSKPIRKASFRNLFDFYPEKGNQRGRIEIFSQRKILWLSSWRNFAPENSPNLREAREQA